MKKIRPKIFPVDQHKLTFQEKYFIQYYQPMTGKFTDKDLIRNKNWFYGWFEALQPDYNFNAGKKKKVLEIGCAIGAASALLAERGFQVVATDVSEYAVKHAKKIVPGVRFEQMDIETTKKFPSTFDLIFSFEVIEHLEKHEQAIANMYRMAKKGGTVICSTPFPYGYVFIDKTHVNVRHPYDWVRIFKRAGFKKVETKQVGFIPFFYRFSKYLHFRLPFGLPTAYINSPVFIIARK